jgi:membrane fusion protein, copper/silver efflux system
MRTRAAAMGGTIDLAALRRELLPLSTRLEAAVGRYHSDEVGPLFRAVCPMVEGREGSWLTRARVVENPYWGSEMFECGEIGARVGG